MKPLPEEIVKRNIINQLADIEAVNINNIYVKVESNEVLLQGHVPTDRVKNEVLRNAAETSEGLTVTNELVVDFQLSRQSGVADMVSRIQGHPNMVITDEIIEHELKDTFEQSLLIDQQKIETKIEGGTIYLSGRVANDPIRKEIEEQALHTKGVNKVINKITVR